jgi:hypothetical protein
MAITVDQVAAVTTGDNVASLTSASTAWSGNIGSGKSIVLVVYGFDNDATGLTFTASWSAGGSFTEETTAIVANGNDRYRASCFYLHGAAGSGTKPTVTVTPSQAAYLNFAMLEVGGLENAAAEAENSNTSTASTTGPTPGAITTTTADALIVLGYVGIDANPQTHAAPAIFTKFGEQTDNNNHQGGCAAYRIVSATQTAYNPAWTTSNSRYAATITAFKIAGAPAATYAPPPRRRARRWFRTMGGILLPMGL